ncbi:Uncharacterized conserved protein [Nitrosospira briensis]|uniref:Uncharacterized conserved protein n=1 Tax=Nitrosospira briensis TaxID=35799 RepID=A0A1I5B534_9PROT|nr:DUF2285 domain-containing protein [Nitrosospira briensis]SFN69609.1 Uncharacterized conserved protein [Nitrosospira briensis]
MSTSKIPAWLPNWKDASAYKKPRDEWFVKIMIWEFLRRNPEYQADYKRFADLPDLRPGGGKTAKIYNKGMMLTDDMCFRYCEPPALPGETWEQYQLRVGDYVIEDMPLIEHLMEKWCITYMADPEKDDGYAKINAHIEMPPYDLQIENAVDAAGFITRRPAPDKPEHVTLRFDLRYGIDKQLKKAKEALKLWKDHLENGPTPYQLDKEQSKNHKNQLRGYLRAFDADLAGAFPQEIGKRLFPKDIDIEARRKKAARAVKLGKDLVNGAYKNLIRLKDDRH